MYLTTPIYYANDVPHVGHAYTTVIADAIARYYRLQQHDVFLLTGTDEHGINIERVAHQRAVTPRQHVDAIAQRFRELWQELDIHHDGFIRTTEPRHKQVALDLWQRIRASGDVYRGTYQGAYCARCEAYYQPGELLDDACPVHGSPCEQVAEENWFFRLSRYQQRLEHLVRETDFVQPATRRNEVLGIIRQGLKDFSVSRTAVAWGIPIPETPDEVLYVWVDALANYISGGPWPAETHLIGKEIIRFHCLYWPALLWSAGLPLPRRVFAHGWLTREGQKISKTTGNTVDPFDLVARFGADALRYYFVRGVPFGQDGDFSEHAFGALYTAELANDFGNLVQRTTALAARRSPSSTRGPVTVAEADLRGHAVVLTERVAEAFESLAVHEAAGAVAEFVRQTNRYLQLTRPWVETDAARLEVVLEHAVEAARLAAWHYAPFIPRASAEAHRRLAGVPPLPGAGHFEPQPRAVRVGPALFPRLAARPAA